MTIEDTNSIAQKLIDHLKSNGVGGEDGVAEFYPNDTAPTSDLPESFVEAVVNGSISSGLSEFGIRKCSLLLILNVKLNGRSVSNNARETYLLGLISGAVSSPFTSGIYHYSIDKGNLVYSGRSLYSGYSSKTISINVKIY